jgi:hypothetical protein
MARGAISRDGSFLGGRRGRSTGAARQKLRRKEQNVQQGLAISQRGYVLANGRIIGQGDAAALRHDPQVTRGYLGL